MKEQRKATDVIPFMYEDTEVRVIKDDEGNPWWVAVDVCNILDIKNPTQAVQQLDEDERAMQNIGRQGNTWNINESGLYALIIRSNKPAAKKFRKWITSEVLPAIRKTGSYTAPAKRQPKALPYGLTHDQQTSIKALVKARVEALPQDKQAKAAITCWSALKSKFGCTYKEIASGHYAEAVSLVARLPLDGELLEAEPAKPELTINYPARVLLELNPHLRGHEPQRFHLRARDLCGMDARSPTLQLLGELVRAGYDVEACRLEVLAMRHHLELQVRLIETLQMLGDNGHNAAIGIRLAGEGQAIR